jgi:hypothetical protein
LTADLVGRCGAQGTNGRGHEEGDEEELAVGAASRWWVGLGWLEGRMSRCHVDPHSTFGNFAVMLFGAHTVCCLLCELLYKSDQTKIVKLFFIIYIFLFYS